MLSRFDNHSRGILAMLASAVIMSCMTVLIRYASENHIDTYKIALFRFAIGAMLIGTGAMFKRFPLRFERSDLLFWRGLLGGASVFLFYLAVAELGIGKGTVISYTYPIFGAAVGSFALRDRVSIGQWLAIALAFVGIVLIVRDKQTIDMAMGMYEMLALLGAIFGGVAIVFVRKLRETDNSYAIYFSQCLFGFWLMVIPANLTSQDIGWTGGIILLSIGTLATAGQLLMTYAFAHVSLATAGPLTNLTSVINTVLALVLFKEHITPYGLAGMALVIGSCMFVSRGKPKAQDSTQTV